MKRIAFIFFIFLTLTSNQTFGQEYDSSYGKPLIVLMETDPWLMVIGSDIPSFVPYEKGQVIYKAIENKQEKIYEAILKQDELAVSGQKNISLLLKPASRTVSKAFCFN